MTHKMLKITPDHIKRLLAEPDVTSAVPMLEGIPAFDEAMVQFATAYADQTERDHAALVQAVADGRVPQPIVL